MSELNTSQAVSSTTIPLVLSVPEVAKLLHIGKNMAYELVNSGALRCIRIGRHIRVPQSALLDYLDGTNSPIG